MEGYKNCEGKFEEVLIDGNKKFKCNKCDRLEDELPFKGICVVSVCARCGKRLSSCVCPKKDK